MTHLMLFSERAPIFENFRTERVIFVRHKRPQIYASGMTISGERTEQLYIFCRVTGFTNDFRLPQRHDDLG